ncbi:uncharacterized protein LOC124142267 isoform X9 [Haliotis rufescens]|uniref:uncharacterized protein LOC124142267 isoform X9 n=1 Tax=Haliotis rufescens TaxID=6454 RepID=UPI001EB01884|nr:uncharacterized protein LOC124142267 isoform X9 [Haliotis rufescens]
MTSNEQVIKTVAKKLKYYFDVKRLEDGFDLSGSQNPVLDHPPMKAKPASSGPHEKHVKHRLKKYMSNYNYQNSNLPEYYYIYTGSSKSLRPDATGVPSKSPKKKPLKGGWPILRTVPSNAVSRGEAERLVNAATKLLVATESVEQSNNPKNGKQTAPRPFEGSLLDYYLSTQTQTSYEGFPGVPTIDEEEARLLLRSRHQPTKTGQRPATAKYTWDIHGRRVQQEEPKAYDDSYLGRSLRPSSSHPSRRPTSKRVYRRLHSPTTSDTVSSRSSVTQTTSTSDMERLPPASRRQRKKSSSQQSVSSRRSDQDRDRPVSSKYRTRTIINVPEVRFQEGVSVQDTTQTTGTQDEIGIQTEKRLIKEYDQQEDEVKQGPWGEYQIYVRTGNTIGASTKADIKLTLYGEHGRTKEMVLGMGDSKKHKVAFQKNKEDLFMLAAHHVGRLGKIKIGHDRVELSNAWFLDSVSVYDMHDKRIYEFPCNQWLSEHDGDRRTYRVLPVDRDRGFIDALDSPGASHNKSRDRRETSEDESDQIVVKHGRESVKAHNSKAGDKSDRSYTGSEYSSSEYETDSDADETAVISPKDKTDKGSKSKSKTYKEEDRSKSGPTFTFRTKNAKTPATRRQTEEVNVDEDTNTTQEEFLAGYKAGISAASAESQKQAEEERAQELEMMQGETVHDAARRGHLDRLKELLHHFPDLKDAKDETGWTPLHHASANARIDVIKWLTTSGVDMNEETRTGYTPIHVAAMNGHVNAMMILSAMGSAITCRTTDQMTPLHLAAKGGYLECVKWLVANRARIDAEDSFKRTAIDLANDRRKTEVVEFLRACLRELKNPHSSFAQMHSSNHGSGERSDRDNDSNWREEKQDSSVSQDAAAGSDDESSVPIKRISSPELKEKKRLYEEQHHKMEERGLSFLDSIRQDLDS